MRTEQHLLICHLPYEFEVPKVFFENYMDLWKIDKEPYRALSNSDDPAYWDTFEDLLKNAAMTDHWGNIWGLHYDGNLYAIPFEEFSHEPI